MTAHYDAIIIGAGAAGLYCALHAGRRGRRVLVLEHNGEAGAKILISGGGRCNFTNLAAGSPERFISANPHFARSALTRHPPREFIALIEKHGIAYYEKTMGQLFCEGARASHKIVRTLLDECSAGSVEIRLNASVTNISKAETFQVRGGGADLTSDTVVIATGGLSIPKLGASAFAYDVAKAFNVPLIPTRPGLVPLTFADGDLAWMRALSGVATEIIARCGGAAFREAALFTHRGLSGPAILQASSYLSSGEPLEIDWLPDCAPDWLAQRKRERPKAHIKAVLSELLPERFAGVLAATLPQPSLHELKDAALVQAMTTLKTQRVTPAGAEGYSKAEVTVGGVSTDALSQQTMEARATPGLFFIGEAVDITGWLGGYNFQWAWSSGWAAAQAL